MIHMYGTYLQIPGLCRVMTGICCDIEMADYESVVARQPPWGHFKHLII